MASPYYNVFAQDTTFPISTAVVVDNIFNQSTQSTTTVTQFYNCNYPLQIRWKAGDFDNTTTLTASTTGTTGTTGSSRIVSVTATSSPSTATSSSSGPKGLSTGSIVAIAVVVGIVLFAALAGFFVWWKKRRPGPAYAGTKQKDPSFGDKKHVNVELETPANTAELGGQATRAELEGLIRSELE